jgi:DnaJ-class molecular chaperone
MATMERLWDPARGDIEHEPTLDELITGAWSQLRRHRAVDCPVCGEAMNPEYGVHALPHGGRCSSCRSTLG